MTISRRAYEVLIYKAVDGWRWRMYAKNSRILADSGEAYSRRDDAKRAARRVFRAPKVVMLTVVKEHDRYNEVEREWLRHE